MLESIQSLVRAPFYDTYLNLVLAENLNQELIESGAAFEKMIIGLTDEQLTYRYGAGKWTLAQVILHCIESELIFTFRALTIAREPNRVELSGYDENVYADALNLNHQTVGGLRTYFSAARASSLGLLKTMRTQLDKIGSANGHDVQVSSLFFIISGHTRHHLMVINSKYLNPS